MHPFYLKFVGLPIYIIILIMFLIERSKLEKEVLIKQNKEMLELMQEMKDICEKQVTQIDAYQEMVRRMNRRLDDYGIGFNCGGYHD